MGIYQRKETGIYYLKIREGKKYRRISLSTKNRYVAEQLYNAYLLDKVQNKISQKTIYTNQAHQKITQNPITEQKRHSIENTYNEYLELCKIQDFTTHTINGKAQLLKIFQDHRIYHIEALNQNTFNKLLKSWGSIKKDTLRKHIANLKAFLNYCIKQKLYKRDDYEAITLPNPKVGIRETTIQEKDYTQIIDSTKDDDFKLYMMTLWETGCRPNEIVPLKKLEIDFNKGIVKVFQTKTKKYKTVYLTDELLKEFENIKTEYLFNAYDKNKAFYARIFKKLRDDLDMNKEYCLYAFRHSFGTRMLNKTKDIHLVSKLLGHSDISITAKHYINRSDSEIREKLLSI